MADEYEEECMEEMSRSEYQQEQYLSHRLPCPHCASANIISLNKKSIICGSIGGLLGGIITGIISFAGFRDKKKIAGIFLIGAFSGVSVGVRFGQSKKNVVSEKTFLCLDCFHFFKRDGMGGEEDSA
ncbi:hypothetical protein AGMMS50267_06060 [Spirochaetia bacterium]|nr:hypothetical protein AGMMS50267_06060 [Spirochaetia bacterium]